MPSLHSHNNKNVSKVWFFILLFAIVLSFIFWDIMQAIQKIETHIAVPDSVDMME